jgi:SAM-dependent methyltransferase
MKRDDILKSLLVDYFKPGCNWLDVGAGDGTVSLELYQLLKPADFHCIDINPGKRKPYHPEVRKFDGTGAGLLKFEEGKTFDFVLFNFVLHHAAHNIVDLLMAAASRAPCIVIQEDLKEEWPGGAKHPGKSVTQLLREHDPKAIYHSFPQWERLLKRLYSNNAILTSVRHPDIPLDDTFGYHVPRGIFIVHAPAR